MNSRICSRDTCEGVIGPRSKKDHCRKCAERDRLAARYLDPRFVARQTQAARISRQKPEIRDRRNAGLRAAGFPTHAAKLAFFAGLKSGPCVDCGVPYPSYVMDWDHRPGEVKLFTISVGKATKARQAVLDEIAKCDLVCSNCHRERTFGCRR